jgi:hypothetical protein
MNRIFTGTALSLILGVFAMASAAPGDGVPWKPLFNGTNLDGWIQRNGKALYEVKDAAIVGTSRTGTPNSFLCTEKSYGDFVLELELKVDAGLNSGVQIRSQSFHDYRNWRVHGYQVEIDPSDRAWSGGIYDEARRGWLNSLEENPAARKAFKVGAWNTYRVEAIGDSIKTWVNGVPAADLVDSLTLSGFIALQVHSTRSPEPKQVMWRNLRIKDLGRHRWKPLFDCATLAGWKAMPGGTWEVADGMIIGTSPQTERRHGLLLSEQRFGDFTVRLSFKALKGNSGFYFRSDRVDGAVGVHGFQAEIDAVNDVGGLYETGGRAWVVKLTTEEVKKSFKPNEWNDMTVSAHGRRIVVHVNGRKTAELKDDPGRLAGHLALQLHGGQEMDVRFRDIELLVPERASDAVMLFNGKDLSNWIAKADGSQTSKWTVGVPAIAPDNPKLLVSKPGTDTAMINLAREHRDSLDLYSKDRFGDVRLELELMVPQGSNSGIYVMGEYEVQVLDSFGKPKEKLGPGDMGAIYGGFKPPICASKAPGAWQKYVIEWRAPRFDPAGKKVVNARFVRVELNGHVLHRDLEMPGKTPGGVTGKEAPTGPLMFQGNHGPVAYRTIKVYPR